jgi:hypothetical protein
MRRATTRYVLPLPVFVSFRSANHGVPLTTTHLKSLGLEMSATLRFPVKYAPECSETFEFLRAHGYVVIPDVLTAEECDSFIVDVWTWLESLGKGITQHNVSSWAPKQWIQMIHGIIKEYGIGQQQFMWNLRTHKEVVRVFQKLWGDERLVCSFDGMSLHRPKELVPTIQSVTKREDIDKPTDWMHLDHTPENPHESVQAFVSLYENTAEDGCLLVYEGSHLLFDEFFAARAENEKVAKHNWYKLTPRNHEWFASRHCRLVRVAAPKGCMVLWNSKTVHSSAFALEDRVKPVMRMVLYVCMVPRLYVDAKTQKKRRIMVLEGRTSSHSPLFPKYNAVVPRHPMLSGAAAKKAREQHTSHLRKRTWDEMSSDEKALI